MKLKSPQFDLTIFLFILDDQVSSSQPKVQPQSQVQRQPPSQSQAQPKPQSARSKPRPKTEEKPSKHDSKDSQPKRWEPEFTNVWGTKQNEPQTSSSSQTQQSARISKNPMSQPIVHPFASQPPITQSTLFGVKQQTAPAVAQSVSQSQTSSSQQQSARGRPRPKVQEPMKPTKDDSKAASSSSQEQSGAWVPQYADVWGGRQPNNPPDTHINQPKTDRPQSQQGKPRPTQQQKQQPRGGPSQRAGTIDDDIDKLSISNVSVASSISSQSSKQSTERSAPIPTSALIPLSPHKGSGTVGRRVSVDVNFLPLLIDKLLPTVYQYDVTIEPNLPKRMLPYIFERYRQNNFKNIFVAFDGQKIAVSPQILPIKESMQQQTKVIDENGRERVYMVAVKEARDCKIDFQSLRK